MRSNAGLQAWAKANTRSNTVTCLGNSLSEASRYFAYLGPLRPARQVVECGWSGQLSRDIAYRWGALAFTCSVTGAQIPASGPVVLTGLGSTIFRRIDYNNYAFRMRLIGNGGEVVDGTLVVTSGLTVPVYTFTRDTAGSAVNVTNPVNVTMLSDMVENSTSVATARTLAELQAGVVNVYPCFNDPANSITSAEMITNANAIAALCKNPVVFGEYAAQIHLTNAASPGLGTAPDAATSKVWLDYFLAYNSAMSATFGSSYLDVPAGVNSRGDQQVVNVLGTNYNINKVTNFPSDGVHPNATESAAIAGDVNAKITALGY